MAITAPKFADWNSPHPCLRLSPTSTELKLRLQLPASGFKKWRIGRCSFPFKVSFSLEGKMSRYLNSSKICSQKNSRLGVKLGPLLFLAAFTHKGHESVPYNNGTKTALGWNYEARIGWVTWRIPLLSKYHWNWPPLHLANAVGPDSPKALSRIAGPFAVADCASQCANKKPEANCKHICAYRVYTYMYIYICNNTFVLYNCLMDEALGCIGLAQVVSHQLHWISQQLLPFASKGNQTNHLTIWHFQFQVPPVPPAKVLHVRALKGISQQGIVAKAHLPDMPWDVNMLLEKRVPKCRSRSRKKYRIDRWFEPKKKNKHKVKLLLQSC